MAAKYVSEADIEDLRQLHESLAEWRLRRCFLLTYREKYTRNRLICLANCFINVECYGTMYPSGVMYELRSLMEGLEDVLTEHRQKKTKLRETIQFVKSSGDKGNNTQPASPAIAGGDSNVNPSQNETICNNGTFVLDNDEDKGTKTKPMTPKQFIHTFRNCIIVYHQGNDTSVNTVEDNMLKNKKKLQIIVDQSVSKVNMYKCEIYVDDILVLRKVDTSKKDAKKKAGIAMMNNLKQVCYCVLVKHDLPKPDSEVERDDAIVGTGSKRKASDAIADTNLGNKLLRKMGWTGGGLGSSGQGIVEPVSSSVETVISRKGLGADTTTLSMSVIQDTLTKYALSDRADDLVFSNEFTKDERAKVHKMAQRLKLKTISRGKDKERYLVVSRPMTPQQLLDYVKSNGGKIGKYELISPVV